MTTLAGKRVLIVGASSGFGEKIAEHFAAEGARLVLSARGTEKLETVAKRVDATTVACDITDYEQVKSLAAQASKALAGLDIAINSAGYEDFMPFRDLTPERVDPMVAVQFTGVLYFIQQMAAAMKEGGSIITISSLTATLVAEGYAHYAGAKAGANHAVRIAASEYGAEGIRVNTVSPTLIETPMTSHILGAPGVRRAFTEETPLGRIGQIDDVVGAVAWLAGDDSSFVTGQNLHVDGGASLRRLPRVADFMRAASEG